MKIPQIPSYLQNPKDYLYLEDHTFKTRSLNYFQQFLRFFCFYPETCGKRLITQTVKLMFTEESSLFSNSERIFTLFNKKKFRNNFPSFSYFINPQQENIDENSLKEITSKFFFAIEFKLSPLSLNFPESHHMHICINGQNFFNIHLCKIVKFEDLNLGLFNIGNNTFLLRTLNITKKIHCIFSENFPSSRNPTCKNKLDQEQRLFYLSTILQSIYDDLIKQCHVRVLYSVNRNVEFIMQGGEAMKHFGWAKAGLSCVIVDTVATIETIYRLQKNHLAAQKKVFFDMTLGYEPDENTYKKKATSSN